VSSVHRAIEAEREEYREQGRAEVRAKGGELHLAVCRRCWEPPDFCEGHVADRLACDNCVQPHGGAVTWPCPTAVVAGIEDA
jgi:hypothetical protein